MKNFIQVIFFVYFFVAALTIATPNDDYQLGDQPDVEADLSEAEAFNVYDTTKLEEGEYEEQQSDGKREKRSFSSNR